MDGKPWRENGKKNFFWVCLVRWRWRKINGKAQVFSPWAHQKVLSPKWGENWEGKAHEMSFQKYAPRWTSPLMCWLFFFPLLICCLLLLYFFIFLFFINFLENNFRLISYATFFLFTLMKCPSIHNFFFFLSIMCYFLFYLRGTWW